MLGLVELIGNDLDNYMVGGRGYVDGGCGVDMMIGGGNFMCFIVDNFGDVVIVELGGYEIVEFLVSFMLGLNIKDLELIGIVDIIGMGNVENNLIIGNFGNNMLDGGFGFDILLGGVGDDVLIVDYIWDEVSGGVGYDMVCFSVSYFFMDVEVGILIGWVNIDIIGGVIVNCLVGNVGVNCIDGSMGVDMMEGGGGYDIYVVDDVGDVVIELGGVGCDMVEVLVNYMLGVNVEDLILIGIVLLMVIGNVLGNWICGNIVVNLIDGGWGVDIMEGGVGVDVYIVDNV